MPCRQRLLPVGAPAPGRGCHCLRTCALMATSALAHAQSPSSSRAMHPSSVAPYHAESRSPPRPDDPARRPNTPNSTCFPRIHSRAKVAKRGHWGRAGTAAQNTPVRRLYREEQGRRRIAHLLAKRHVWQELLGKARYHDTAKETSRENATKDSVFGILLKPSQRMCAQHAANSFTEPSVYRCESVTFKPKDAGLQLLSCESSPAVESSSRGNKGSNAPRNPTSQIESQPPAANNDMDDSADPNYAGKSEEQQSNESSKEGAEPEEGDGEEHIALSYQIPETTLRTAMQASPNTKGSFWSQLFYRGPNDEQLATHYCRTYDVAERVARYFVNEKVVGFDIEWKPFGYSTSIKNNASLIQVASESRIALFHIALYKGKTAAELLPPTLKAILESPDIYKVGVAVKSDFSRLEKYLHVQPRGVLELSRLHNLVEFHDTDPSKITNRLVSLARQVHQHLQLPLYKGEPLVGDPKDKASVRESDWSRPLSHEQIHYAAADAYAGIRLYDVLEMKRKALRPTPPTPRLCDDDPKFEKPKAPKAKAKATDEPKAGAQAAAQPTTEDQKKAGDSQYDTVPKELTDKAAKISVPTSSQSASDSQDSSEDPDSDPDFVPSRDHQSQAPTRRTRQRGSMRLDNVDPGYPTLPTLSSPEESDADESDAFDPPPKRSRPEDTNKGASSKEAPDTTQNESDSDEFADPELEEAFMGMDLGSKPRDGPLNSEQPQYKAGELHAPATEPPVSEASSPAFTPLASSSTNHTPEYTAASKWAQSYLHSTIPSPQSRQSSRIRATVTHLRAYHLWHHQQLPLDVITSHLRDPPLAQSSVANYILHAVQSEGLDYKKEDLRELLRVLPSGLRKGRWRGWCKRLDVT